MRIDFFVNKRLQAVTDGRGQLLAIADSLGQITEAYAGSGHDQSSWQGAGLTTQAQTFNPRKWQTDDEWGGIQQFRNRAYDSATGTWIQEDPMGVAGGVNVYRFNNGNPVSFGDPFGLCPPENTNVGDCPDDALGRAWRKLDESSAGRKVIRDYVDASARVSVDTDISQCSNVANCTIKNGGNSDVHVSGRTEAIAIGLGHEVVHVNGTAEPCTSQSVKEEEEAWRRAFDVYRALTTSEKAASGYSGRQKLWNSNNAGFMHQIKSQILGNCR